MTPTGSDCSPSAPLTAESAAAITRVGWATSAGHHRSLNEDAVLVGPHWFAVADGMGGHAAGDVASTIAVDVLAGHARATTSPADIAAAVRDASTTIHRAATGPRAGMGTTLVGVAPLHDGGLAVFHCGDARCYRLLGGELTLLTTDHSHVQELVDDGLLDPADAARHPLRNVVTRAVGLAPDVEPTVCVVRDPVGRLLLCSDGLSGELTPRTIGRVLAAVDDPDAAAHRLVELVLQGPARDNVTAVVLDTARGRRLPRLAA